MDDRSSDTEEKFAAQGPPGDASSQNAEEPQTPQGQDDIRGGTGGQGTSPDSASHAEDDSAGRPGGASEESQATGNPSAAG